MAAAFKPRTTKKRIQLREGSSSLRLDIEPVLGSTRSADAKHQKVSVTPGHIVRRCTDGAVSGRATFVDAGAAERAGPFTPATVR